ncbi:hypothetical protein C8R46DRAFT_1216580 [Mycena filopes]|nr:hypothetical protein C8R46DRAFT_1216580 [Mycena filopes]
MAQPAGGKSTKPAIGSLFVSAAARSIERIDVAFPEDALLAAQSAGNSQQGQKWQAHGSETWVVFVLDVVETVVPVGLLSPHISSELRKFYRADSTVDSIARKVVRLSPSLNGRNYTRLDLYRVIGFLEDSGAGGANQWLCRLFWPIADELWEFATNIHEPRAPLNPDAARAKAMNEKHMRQRSAAAHEEGLSKGTFGEEYATRRALAYVKTSQQAFEEQDDGADGEETLWVFKAYFNNRKDLETSAEYDPASNHQEELEDGEVVEDEEDSPLSSANQLLRRVLLLGEPRWRSSAALGLGEMEPD